MLSVSNSKLTAHQVMDESSITTEESTHTIRMILFNSNLDGCIAEKKALLTKKQTKQNKTKNIEWAENTGWKNICYGIMKNGQVYCDESKIELNYNTREYVRRPIGTRDHPKYATKTVTFLGVGYFKGNGTKKVDKNWCNSEQEKNKHYITRYSKKWNIPVWRITLQYMCNKKNIWLMQTLQCYKSGLPKSMNIT